MNLKIAKELEQKAKQRDKKGILELLAKIPELYPLLINHINLQVLKDEQTKLEAKVKDWKWPSLTDKLFDKESFIKCTEGKPAPKHRTIVDDVYDFAALLCSFTKDAGKTDIANKPYIPFTKAMDILRGKLTETQLRYAIKKGDVRSDKPSKQRLTVHIQDVFSLISKSKISEDAQEEAAGIFGRLLIEQQRKRDDKLDLS